MRRILGGAILASRLARMKSRSESLYEYRARLARALLYIQANLAGEVSLDEAASAACFSKYHFHRLFTALVGESLADYVRRLRLERAANLLEQKPSLSVTEVAARSGFSSPSLLSRDFAARFSLPPSRWREARRASAASSRAFGRGETEAEEQGRESLAASETPSARHLPALRFASVLCHEGYGPGIGEAWAKLYRWAGPRGLVGAGTRPAGVSWDNPEITAAGRCRYSACLPLPEGRETSGEICLLEFPARDYLVLAYRGDEAGLSAAYSSLYRRHLPESGYEPADAPAIEFYKAQPGLDRVFDLEIALPVSPMP